MKNYLFTNLILFLFFILVLWAIIFFSPFSSSSVREYFNQTHKNTFIHVPKTGGSAIHKVMKKKYPDNFDVYSNHFHNLVATQYNQPILCIREPIDRFLSIYKYWKQNVHDFYPMINTSVKYFIYCLKNNSDKLLFGNPSILSEYHYFPQSYFIAPDAYPYSIVLIYDKTEMKEKLQSLFEYLNLENPENFKLKMNNVSKKTDIILDEEDLHFIYNRYHDDFVLWDKLNQQPEMFKKVI
jgi:hypothetical protein